MADLNSLDMTGRLTRDPELRHTPGGDTVTNFRLACNGPRGDDDAVFVDVDVWGKQAEAVAQYLRQGSRVAVSGRLGVRDWTAEDGSERRSVECNSARAYFLESKSEAAARGGAAAPPDEGSPATGAQPAGSAPPPDDDDIPF